MKSSRICICLLLLCGLAALVGCRGGVANYTFKGVEQQTQVVRINNCVATPDSAKVKEKSPVHWVVDDNSTYIVVFHTISAIPGDTPIISGSSPDTTHTVNTGCSQFTGGCGGYPYSLIQISPDQKQIIRCKDPGFHVVP